ncbi:microtubule-associated protein RP/EB family member 2 [Drosophila tropicalis]|uniref:microtubule-associated protein RP/EB family member 2 n=1 Tax=Drosophila tropicalis TaxID=46794 RepID=UPI0035ABC03F
MLNLAGRRREYIKVNPIRAKNVIVCKKDTLSQRGLTAWISKVLETEVMYLNELRTGAIYCQLLHRLYPKSIMFSKVHLFSNSTNEYEYNFRLLIASFVRLRINRDVPVENLMKGAGHYEFCNWFYQFSLANDKGGPYNAKEMRQNSAIGLNRNFREFQRSHSTISFQQMRGALECNRPGNLGGRSLGGSISIIAPRTKAKTYNDDLSCKHPEVNYCEESKNVKLPPASDSEDESVGKHKSIKKTAKIPAFRLNSSLGNSCYCKDHPLPKFISTRYAKSSLCLKGPSPNNSKPKDSACFKCHELQLLHLRKLYREANDKLDSIKGILLKHSNDPNYSIVHITAIIFNPESLSRSPGDAEFF